MSDWLSKFNRGDRGSRKKARDKLDESGEFEGMTLSSALNGVDEDVVKLCAVASLWPYGKKDMLDVLDEIFEKNTATRKDFVRQMTENIDEADPDDISGTTDREIFKGNMEAIALRVGLLTIMRYLAAKVGQSFGPDVRPEDVDDSKRDQLFQSTLNDLGITSVEDAEKMAKKLLKRQAERSKRIKKKKEDDK